MELRVVKPHPTAEEALRERIEDIVLSETVTSQIIGAPGGPASIQAALSKHYSSSGGLECPVYVGMDGTTYVTSGALLGRLNYGARVVVHPKTLATWLRRIGFDKSKRVSFTVRRYDVRAAEVEPHGVRRRRVLWMTAPGWTDPDTLKAMVENELAQQAALDARAKQAADREKERRRRGQGPTGTFDLRDGPPLSGAEWIDPEKLPNGEVPAYSGQPPPTEMTFGPSLDERIAAKHRAADGPRTRREITRGWSASSGEIDTAYARLVKSGALIAYKGTKTTRYDVPDRSGE